VGCPKYREANPAFSVTKLTGAVAAPPAAGIYNLAQVAEVLCNALCLHRCRVALVERPEMVPAVHKQRSREQVRAIEYAR
jgi:hypothetical protein